MRQRRPRERRERRSGGGAAPVALGSGPADALQEQYEDVIKAVLPSVVQISTPGATGSGVVFDDKGDIVTNAHVVGSASTVQVTPDAGGAMLTAKVVGVFAPDDLAVIRVTSGAGSLRPANFGQSAGVTAGQIVLAAGQPARPDRQRDPGHHLRDRPDPDRVRRDRQRRHQDHHDRRHAADQRGDQQRQ